MRNAVSRASVLLGAVLLVCACGGESADLGPEITAHLEEYESLIKEFEPRFAAVRNDPPAFAKVADDYKQKTQAWMSRWEKVAPNPSDEEGRAIKARINRLNQRAVSMLTTG